jgi:hypothetical protein
MKIRLISGRRWVFLGERFGRLIGSRLNLGVGTVDAVINYKLKEIVMKKLVSIIALMVGLMMFVVAPANALSYGPGPIPGAYSGSTIFKNVRPVSNPVPVKAVYLFKGIQSGYHNVRPVSKPVQACIVGKKLVVGTACKGRK